MTDVISNPVAITQISVPFDTSHALVLGGDVSGLIGPIDAGTEVTVTLAQDGVSLTLAAADGTGTALNADGVHLDILGPFPLPALTGFVSGKAATLSWSAVVGGNALLFQQTGTVGAAALGDLDWQSGFPVVNFGAGTSLLGLGTKEWIHVPLSASDAASGLPFDLSATTVTMALYNWLSADDPMPSDFQSCDMLIRTAAPFGTFARARFDTAALGLPRASYRVRVKITLGPDTVVLTAPGAIQIR